MASAISRRPLFGLQAGEFCLLLFASLMHSHRSMKRTVEVCRASELPRNAVARRANDSENKRLQLTHM
jgi:hypothetical protein